MIGSVNPSTSIQVLLTLTYMVFYVLHRLINDATRIPRIRH